MEPPATVVWYGAQTPGGYVPEQNQLLQPETFPMVNQIPGLYQVLLPSRPNGSTGWVSVADITVSGVATYVRAYLSHFRMEYQVGGVVQEVFTVEVGKPQTPTCSHSLPSPTPW